MGCLTVSRCRPLRQVVVEPPGTAPGSGPSITSAFIAIVPKNKETLDPCGIAVNMIFRKSTGCLVSGQFAKK